MFTLENAAKNAQSHFLFWAPVFPLIGWNLHLQKENGTHPQNAIGHHWYFNPNNMSHLFTCYMLFWWKSSIEIGWNTGLDGIWFWFGQKASKLRMYILVVFTMMVNCGWECSWTFFVLICVCWPANTLIKCRTERQPVGRDCSHV